MSDAAAEPATTVGTPEQAATKPKKKKVSKPKDKKADARKVSGLRRFQIRTLDVLSKSKDPVPVATIAKRAKISHTMVVMGLGTIDPKLLKAHDKKMGFASLLTLGHCKVMNVEGITGLFITPSGRKALASAMDKIGGKLPKVKVNPVAA